jgi:hypothetical protein
VTRRYTARRGHPDTPAEPRKVWPRLPRLDWLGTWGPDRVLLVIPVGLVGGVLLRWWLYQS